MDLLTRSDLLTVVKPGSYVGAALSKHYISGYVISLSAVAELMKMAFSPVPGLIVFLLFSAADAGKSLNLSCSVFCIRRMRQI